MSCSCTGKNQTHKLVTEFIDKKSLNIHGEDKDYPGFGLFLVPAPELGILETKTIKVEAISYSECAKRGFHCLAFQWIPKDITITLRNGNSISVDSISKLEEITRDCHGGCRGGCPMGCFCWEGRDVVCHE